MEKKTDIFHTHEEESDKAIIDQAITLILAEVTIKRITAEHAYNASWINDYDGPSALEDQVKFYRYGQRNLMPTEWQSFIEQAKNELDPEYQLYLKLQHKFEGR